MKVIIEACLLNTDEKKKAANAVLNARAACVKTSTGFSTGGATIEDVTLLHSVVRDKAFVKAAGGIRNYETAVKMIEAGAKRLGTSSGVKIISEAE